jgi:hypothetical protein
MKAKINDLVLLEPLLEQLHAALLQDGPAKLDGLVPVELARLEENAEVLEESRLLAGGHRGLLQTLDGGRAAEDALKLQKWKRSIKKKSRQRRAEQVDVVLTRGALAATLAASR